MKRTILIFLLILSLVLAGCANSAQNPSGAPEPAEPDSGQSVYEYGEPNIIASNEGYLYCYLLYPKTGNTDIDKTIYDWAYSVYTDAQEELALLYEEDTALEGEINLQYNAYLVRDAYVGIEELGFYSHSHMAHPTDFVKIFNIDLTTQTLIENDKILDAAREADVLALLRGKILERYPDMTANVEEMDGEWLENIVLNHDGIDVVLERGEHLPSAFGLLTFSLPYTELGAAFILSPASAETPITQTASFEAVLSETTTPPPAEPAPETQLALPPLLMQDGFDPDKPIIALTFDDGPSKVTPRILDLLGQYGARATFCVVGNRVNSYPDIVRRVVAEGSELIGHSWDHKQLTKLSADGIQAELVKTKDVIYETAGVSPLLYRPPYGAVNNSVKTVSASLGLSIINWSIDTKDWKSRNAESVYQAVMSQAADGGIILCHDLYGSTADAMERVIPELIARGYQLVTVSELLSASGAPIEAGTVYYKR